MSTKHFCDVCGDELVDANTPKTGVRLQHGTKAGLWVDVHTGFDEHLEDTEHPKGLIWNHGEFCKYCVIDAVKELDDRPKQGEERRDPPIDAQGIRRYHRAELDALVDRFLAWPVPDNELADECASSGAYTIAFPHTRTGTNFLSAAGAQAMLAHVLELEP